jgi:hypothetical protein
MKYMASQIFNAEHQSRNSEHSVTRKVVHHA